MLSGDLPEPRRHAYLAVLGVPLFLARAQLPGAAPARIAAADMPDESAAGAFPEAVPRDLPVIAQVAETAAARLPAPDLPAPAVGASSAASVLEGLRAAGVAVQPARPVPQVAEPEPVSVAAPAAAADEPRFSCRLLRVTASQAVLLDLGDYPDLGPQEQSLWEGLCRAFGWQPEALSADFSWPLGQGRSGVIGRDSESARGVMQGWLARDLGEDMRLLVLGEPLAGFVQRPHRQLPALSALLASPLAKRALWLQLAGDD